MKKILITGANSYIGTSFEKYMAQWPDRYQVDTVDMIDGAWRKKDFSDYDAVFHVAGIAHQKETQDNAHLYYKINRDLAIETAEKAKREGIGHFIFLSSMSVYGVEEGVITPATEPVPKSNYGKSKWEAEIGIGKLRDDGFRVAVLRPPMVYGDGCKGNYQALVKFAEIMPVFPNYQNQRSMVHIGCLCQYVKEYLDTAADGLFLPQDENYVCTCEMVRLIAAKKGKNLRLMKFLNPAVWILAKCTVKGKKAFGNLTYSREA